MGYEKFGRYRAMDIHAITLDEYLNLEDHERNDRSHWWYISNKQHLVLGDEVVGYIENREVKLFEKRVLYKQAYFKEVKAKMKAAAPTPVYKIVSERPTVEALAKEGEKKLEVVSTVAEKNLQESLGVGEEKLAQFAAEGEKKVEAVQRKPRPRKKRTMEG